MEKKDILILAGAGLGIGVLVLWWRDRAASSAPAALARVSKNGPTAAPSPGPTLTPGILASMYPRGSVATGSFEQAFRSLFAGIGGGKTGGAAEERAGVAATRRVAQQAGGWLSRVFGSLKAAAPATTADTTADDARGSWWGGIVREWTDHLRTAAAPSDAMERLRTDPGLVAAQSALPEQYRGLTRLQLAKEEARLDKRIEEQQSLLNMITRELTTEPSNARLRIQEDLARRELERLNGLRWALFQYLQDTVGR